jgi:hypothetical protein
MSQPPPIEGSSDDRLLVAAAARLTEGEYPQTIANDLLKAGVEAEEFAPLFFDVARRQRRRGIVWTVPGALLTALIIAFTLDPEEMGWGLLGFFWIIALSILMKGVMLILAAREIFNAFRGFSGESNTKGAIR